MPSEDYMDIDIDEDITGKLWLLGHMMFTPWKSGC
jgi:hypothetical protein